MPLVQRGSVPNEANSTGPMGRELSWIMQNISKYKILINQDTYSKYLDIN